MKVGQLRQELQAYDAETPLVALQSGNLERSARMRVSNAWGVSDGDARPTAVAIIFEPLKSDVRAVHGGPQPNTKPELDVAGFLGVEKFLIDKDGSLRSLHDMMRDILEGALEQSKYNVHVAADRLGITNVEMITLMEKHGVD